jgi:D-sedoheptulose 7-phosphate isomerase
MKIETIIRHSIEIKQKILVNKSLLNQIEQLADLCIQSLKVNGKIIFCGNGGSFADAQHLSAEFTSKFLFDRNPLASVVLGANNSAISAIGNDYGYDQVFAREIDCIGSENDIFIPISTSGNSLNILKAVERAKSKSIKISALTGESGGKLIEMCECIRVPSSDTARIQEAHILIGHIVCEIVENEMFS